MSRFVFSFGVIISGLFLGYAVQKMNNLGVFGVQRNLDRIRINLQRFGLIVLSPIAIAGAIWIIKFDSAKLAALPFIGVFAFVSGGILALIASRMMGLPGYRTGSMFGCGSYANIGAVGSLICFVFLGEYGYALVPLYKLFEEVVYYGIGFPIAKTISGDNSAKEGPSQLRLAVKDPFIISALLGIIAGFSFNLSGLHRPEIYSTINSIIIPLMTISLLVSIGLSLRFSRVQNYVKEALAVSAIKFIIVPVLTVTLAYLCGLSHIENGLPLKVVLILSSMPVAFVALIPPSIYKLDIDLANSCWLVTTMMLVFELPLLLWLVG